MSEDRLYMHREKGDGLVVNCGKATMSITELRVRPMSNFVTPYELLGRGGARIALTPRQFLEALSEYARYTLQDPIAFIAGQVGYSFQLAKQCDAPADFALTRLSEGVGLDTKNKP